MDQAAPDEAGKKMAAAIAGLSGAVAEAVDKFGVLAEAVPTLTTDTHTNRRDRRRSLGAKKKRGRGYTKPFVISKRRRK